MVHFLSLPSLIYHIPIHIQMIVFSVNICLSLFLMYHDLAIEILVIYVTVDNIFLDHSNISSIY